jgi:hypothetical protein
MRPTFVIATVHGVDVLSPDLKGGRFGTRCQAHPDRIEAWPSAGVALIAARRVSEWCDQCGIESRWSLTAKGRAVLAAERTRAAR